METGKEEPEEGIEVKQSLWSEAFPASYFRELHREFQLLKLIKKALVPQYGFYITMLILVVYVLILTKKLSTELHSLALTLICIIM